ncbi:MAG TPA: ABC transporter substrate-binding protein [Anaerolineae bacterium]
MSTRRLTRREFLRIAGLTSAGAVVAACAPAVPLPTPTSAPAVAPTTAPTAAPAATAATGPKYGGTLRIATSLDATYLGNPATMVSVQDFVESKTCIESLARYDANAQMVPWLAEGWKIDAQAKTITVTLKKGIKFHDGTDFNALACKWNLDHFVGAKRAELPGVTSVQVIDDYTLRINLAAWDNTAIVGMGYFAGPQISPTAWQKAGATDKERDDWAANNPVGTGPFQFVSRVRDSKQVYKKFDGYWQKGKPYLDGIEWSFIVDPLVQAASFQRKEQDVLYLLTPLMAKNLKADGNNVVQLKTGMGLLMYGIMANSLAGSPFAEVKLRQAISYAIDSKAIVDSQFFGYGIAIQQWGVPNGYWANPNFKGYPYDPAKAKQLVAEAGYPNGLKTKLLVVNTPDTVGAATAVQGMLAQANINVDLDVADNTRYRSLTSGGGKFEALCFASFRADSDLALVMPRNLSAKGTIMVNSIIHPDDLEKLLTEAKQAPDQETKRAKVWELQQMTFEKYAIFTPLVVPDGLAAKQPYVRNDGMMVVEQTQWTPEDVWLDK